MATKGSFAVVLGASVGGLLAARVLADHFEQVVVLERDVFLPLGDAQKSVPEGTHAHVLLAAGRSVLERLFVGFTHDMGSLGASPVDALSDVNGSLHGHRLAAHESDVNSLRCARPVLQAYLRLRVQQLPNVIVRQGCEALALIGDYREVRGVQLRTRDDCHQYLHAALVVDATGRSSRLPSWLNQLGLESPDEEQHFPYRKRVRYERLAHTPEGLLAFADALCSFTPIYGQGTTVAALEAELLGKLLSEGPHDLAQRFYDAAARIVDAAWLITAGAELSVVEAHGTAAHERSVGVSGERTFVARIVRRYLKHLAFVASVDAEAARRVVRVLQLVDAPSALLAPALLLRAWTRR